MRILSSFTDFYDQAATKKLGTVTYHRKILFGTPGPKQLDSALSFPDPSGIIQRRYGFELDYLLIAGTLWPILRNRKVCAPVHSEAARREFPEMKGWESFTLSRISSNESALLQRAVGSPVARIAPSTHGKIWLYPDIPILANYGIEGTELPERVAAWIESWLTHNPQPVSEVPPATKPLPRRVR